MAAILRVKRKKEDEPLDALLISCKRIKVNEGDDEATTTTSDDKPLSALVKFAGTVEKAEDCAVEHITKSLSKNYLKANYKQHIVDVNKKIRDKVKQKSNENRYKVVNSVRSVDAALAGRLDEDVVNIIDIEDTKDDTNDQSTKEYVYDLYYTETKDDLQVDHLLSVMPIEENELVFDDHYKDEQERDGETSDSNSESNWRNDYPDSDEYEDEDEDSINEAMMRKAMKKLGIEDDLSSDDEDFAYGLDEKDVDNYGYKYAKYKARIKAEEQKNSDDYEEFDAGSNHSDSDDHDSDWCE